MSYTHFQKEVSPLSKFKLWPFWNFSITTDKVQLFFLFFNVFRKRNFNSEVGIKFLTQKITPLTRKEAVIDQRTSYCLTSNSNYILACIEIIVGITYAQKRYINNYLQSKNRVSNKYRINSKRGCFLFHLALIENLKCKIF